MKGGMILMLSMQNPEPYEVVVGFRMLRFADVRPRFRFVSGPSCTGLK